MPSNPISHRRAFSHSASRTCPNASRARSRNATERAVASSTSHPRRGKASATCATCLDGPVLIDSSDWCRARPFTGAVVRSFLPMNSAVSSFGMVAVIGGLTCITSVMVVLPAIFRLIAQTASADRARLRRDLVERAARARRVIRYGVLECESEWSCRPTPKRIFAEF